MPSNNFQLLRCSLGLRSGDQSTKSNVIAQFSTECSLFTNSCFCHGLLQVLNGLLSRNDQKEAISIPIGIIPAGSDNSLVWTVLGVRDPVSAAIAIVKVIFSPYLITLFSCQFLNHDYRFFQISALRLMFQRFTPSKIRIQELLQLTVKLKDVDHLLVFRCSSSPPISYSIEPLFSCKAIWNLMLYNVNTINTKEQVAEGQDLCVKIALTDRVNVAESAENVIYQQEIQDSNLE